MGDESSGGRIALARKLAGGAWSGTLPLVTGISPQPLYPGVDGAGNATVAYTSLGTTWIATWPAASSAATITPMSGAPLILGGLAVDGAGDAVFAGRSSASPSLLTVGYRQGANGAFVLRTYPSFGASVVSTRVAINEFRMAAVVLGVGTTLLAITRSGASDWPTSAETVENSSRWLEIPRSALMAPAMCSSRSPTSRRRPRLSCAPRCARRWAPGRSRVTSARPP